MLWLFVAAAAYFLLAVASLIDKFLLSGSLSNPRIYAFYVGVLGSLAFLLVPLGYFAKPASPFLLFAALLAGFCQIIGIYFYFDTLKKFETSRVIPAIGGMQPLFSFALAWFFSGGRENLDLPQIIAFFLMVAGSVAVVFEKRMFEFRNLRMAALTAFLFALALVLSKLVYLGQSSFLPGFILISFGSVLTALLFLVFDDVRKEVFKKQGRMKFNKTAFLFFINQAGGAGAFVLQNFAVALAPLAFVAVINAMAGVQYVFIFVFSVIISVYFPGFLKEKISREIIVQKILAIVLIIAGLAVFAVK